MTLDSHWKLRLNRMHSAACLVLVVLAGAASAPSLSGAQQPEPSALRTTASEYLAKAQAISPGDGAAFFLLGEDAADLALATDSIELRSIAVQILVTAHEHARARGTSADRATRVSALLALADVLPTRSDRDRVRALAALIDPNTARSVQQVSSTGPQAQQSVDYLVALVLGSVRSGDGSRARQLLRRSDVRERLQSLDGMLTRAKISGGVARILEEAQRWPCSLCGGTKLEKPSRGNAEPRLCTSCQGVPGPKLTAQETLAWLRVESQLLQLDHASWAAQRALDSGEPLSIVDDEDLPRWIGVQPLVPPPSRAPATDPAAQAPSNDSPSQTNAPASSIDDAEKPAEGTDSPPAGG